MGNMLAIGLVFSMKFHHRTYMFSSDDDEVIPKASAEIPPRLLSVLLNPERHETVNRYC